jgi:hypothetical protein
MTTTAEYLKRKAAAKAALVKAHKLVSEQLRGNIGTRVMRTLRRRRRTNLRRSYVYDPKDRASEQCKEKEDSGMIKSKLVIAVVAVSLLAASSPASAWCNYYGCDYDDGGAVLGGMFAGMALGATIAGAAAQQQQQFAAPVCYARNGNPYYAQAWRGRWVC